MWYGESVAAQAVRTALAPASWMYRSVVAARNGLYDAGLIRTYASPVPVISIGNLTVGGTGKTPFAAYIVERLRAMGCSPAIVMRGYGDDERLLHAQLNPGVRVYAQPDRVEGITRAASDGADVVVLDDAFQHRRASRAFDIVLVSADQWRDDLGLLPAGPLREPLRSIRRADLIVVTSKSASTGEISRVKSRLTAIAPEVPTACVEFKLRDLVDARKPERMTIPGALSGADVLAVAGIGNPESFLAQLRELGACVTAHLYPDHHAYNVTDVATLALAASGHKYLVTTGKDAVKLAPLWPAKAATLWYVSQAVQITGGEPAVTQALRDIVSR